MVRYYCKMLLYFCFIKKRAIKSLFLKVLEYSDYALIASFVVIETFMPNSLSTSCTRLALTR